MEDCYRQLTDEEIELITLEMWERGSYDPPLIDEKEAMPGIEILDEIDDCCKRKDLMEKANRDAAGDSTNSNLTVRILWQQACLFLVFLIVGFLE